MPLREIKDRWRNDISKLKIVLFQEIARYNRLLDYSRNSLEQLQKGIKGFVVISSELEAVMNSLFENRVPKVWGFAYLSAKPLAAWIRDLEMRIKQLHDWAYGATPSVFWISGFTYPTGFTTALLQQTAARSESSIDTLSWDFLVQKYDAQLVPVKDGAYIRGLFLEGAKWNDEEGCLMEPEPMELTWLMPVIHFKPVKEKKKAKNNMYSCPCYVYPVRSGTREKPSFMLSVDLKSGERTPQFWIKRGTALLMSLET
jgi:dynein heavy chain